ncbi:dual specificity protein phosphatase [Lipomyces oligophaga]|uniref:dual specificity protein phosphatase n=1 Tax=Lipomyces oligophaga TaxID=45792 RepID=UPI0034CF5861
MPNPRSPRKHPLRIPTIEFLKDRLYLAASDSIPQDTDTAAYFTVDDSLPYNAFHHDFGPLHVGHLYRFAVVLHEILAEEYNQEKSIVFYSGTNSRARANAACLLCCYMVLIQSWPPHLALAPIAGAEPPMMPFRDAGYSVADFTLAIQDIVYGVWKAKEKGLLDLRDFNLEEYEKYERVEMGDFNTIPPHFVAFASPQYLPIPGEPVPKMTTSLHNVIDFFVENHVDVVVRLNSPLYDKSIFEANDINHIDMIFEDGTCPEMEIVRQFVGVCAEVVASKKMIAVHCKAGLGRTGCLIGAYLIYEYGFTANEVIGYMRFMRPGMVVGPQQHWLYLHQQDFREWKYTMGFGAPSAGLAGHRPLVSISYLRDLKSSPRTPIRRILSDVETNAASLPAPTPGQPRKSPMLDTSGDENRMGPNVVGVAESGSTQSETDATQDIVVRKTRSASANSPSARRAMSFSAVTMTTTTTTTTTIASPTGWSAGNSANVGRPQRRVVSNTLGDKMKGPAGGVRKVSARTKRL